MVEGIEQPCVLIVEDTATLAITYAAQLERAGIAAQTAASGEAALAALAQRAHFAAVLLDLQLPDGDGLSLLRDNPAILARQPVVVVTADASLSRAIEAMRLGAYDFLVKPVAPQRLVGVVQSAIATHGKAGRAVEATAAPLARGPEASPGAFIGSSPVMRELYRQLGRVARSRATVFITGESGTGKEVCAEAIHRESGRREGAFIAINCGAIPENLLESELFGHIKGSFTGAVSDRVGAAQAADRGTLFLDEICEMALPLQVKLLRFLQTGTIQRVGSTRVEEVDVRIICATNRDPVREVAEGRFREDLYYRLAVVPLHMPPLRDRGADIAELAEAFLQRFAAEEGKRFALLGAAQIARLSQWRWPGNVRELQNVLRRAAVLEDGPEVPLRALPGGDDSPMPEAPRAGTVAAPVLALSAGDRIHEALRGLTLDEIEQIAIEAAVEQAGGSLPGAARLLGVSPSTLYRKRERRTREDSPQAIGMEARP